MKKYIFFLIGLVFASAITIGLNVIHKAEANRPYGPARHQCQTASTSPTYINMGTASSTCIIDISTVEDADFNFALTASTSPMKFNYVLYYSYDRTAATRNWFPEKGYTVTSDEIRTYGAKPLMNTITPNDTTASTTYHNISANDLRANFVKIEYMTEVTNGSAYIELVK